METGYLALTPRNVVSVVRTGKQPDIFADKDIRIYPTCLEAIINCSEVLEKPQSGIRQTFVFQLSLPKVEDSPLLQKVRGVGEEYFCCTQFDAHWIVHAKVCTEASQRLLMRLFNSSQVVAPLDFTIIVEKDSFEIKREEPVPAPQPIALKPIASPRAPVIIEKQGDLLGSTVQTLVNTVNCEGVMGKGIALQFKTLYPAMFLDYKKKCDKNDVVVGCPYLYKVNALRNIINFPTKQGWRNPSQLEWIEQGLIYLQKHLKEWGVTSLALPPLGCGNGGLDWKDVKPLIEKYLRGDIPIEIYVPFGKGDKNSQSSSSTTPPPKRQKTLESFYQRLPK